MFLAEERNLSVLIHRTSGAHVTECHIVRSHMTSRVCSLVHVCMCAFMCVQHALDALISRKLRSAEANARAFVVLLLLSHSQSSDTDPPHKCHPLHHVIARAVSFFLIQEVSSAFLNNYLWCS